MEVRLLEKGKDTIELEMDGVNETVLHPLKKYLTQDKKVSLATYSLGHPQLEKPKLFVKVSDGKPQAALKRATKALANEYKELRDLVEKKCK